jgi:ABC-type dipeptide/oligopeptide/nickel transport system permease subunit
MKIRGISMSGVKRMCKKGAKIALSIVVSVGLIGFVKGLLIGYYIGIHKAKYSLRNNLIQF